MNDGYGSALRLLPEELRSAARCFAEREKAEEIRLRRGREATVLLPVGERTIARGHIVGESDIAAVLETATRCSLHSVQAELRRGYISAMGGVRVGVCGTAVMGERVESLRDFSSLSLRIPRQIKSAGEDVIAPLSAGDRSLLILSPPGGGKTTLLRELVRRTGDRGVRVALADERCEVAAVWHGVPQFDVGACTDVLSGAPKSEGAMLLLRAMNPQVIALDEITEREDIMAIASIANCGVRVFAAAHAASAADLERRTLYRELLALRVFELAVVISGTVERSYKVETL